MVQFVADEGWQGDDGQVCAQLFPLFALQTRQHRFAPFDAAGGQAVGAGRIVPLGVEQQPLVGALDDHDYFGPPEQGRGLPPIGVAAGVQLEAAVVLRAGTVASDEGLLLGWVELGLHREETREGFTGR